LTTPSNETKKIPLESRRLLDMRETLGAAVENDSSKTRNEKSFNKSMTGVRNPSSHCELLYDLSFGLVSCSFQRKEATLEFPVSVKSGPG
jgi:hypothetical protein